MGNVALCGNSTPKRPKVVHFAQHLVPRFFVLSVVRDTAPHLSASTNLLKRRLYIGGVTYLTSRSCPVPTSSTYPTIGISLLKDVDAFKAVISSRMFVSTVPGDHAQPITCQSVNSHAFLILEPIINGGVCHSLTGVLHNNNHADPNRLVDGVKRNHRIPGPTPGCFDHRHAVCREIEVA